ncbi:hypothetical protein M9458_008193 [Cirrhinus mrigala]|uniref:Pyrin domain-containing protein n=1 Tax=Cirrhinus mrigala TaxID=683832 RepID=A0ABD0R7Z8_CIRMR
MASVEELLLNSLIELEEASLKRFQWHLKKDHECISESEMENADMIKTVDKMVDCFGPEEAVKNMNKLAEQLKNKHKKGNVTFTDCNVIDCLPLRLRAIRTHLSLLELIQIKPQVNNNHCL